MRSGRLTRPALRHRRRTLPLIASLALLAGCSTAPPASPTAAIVIGVAVTRDTADQAAAESVVTAVRSIVDSRYHGRVQGVPVSVRVLDDSTQGRPDPVRAAANLRTLIADPHVLGVVGPLQSSIAVTEIPVAAAAHLVLVSPGNTNGCLTHVGGDCQDLATQLRGGRPVSYFRVLSTDDAQGEAAASFAAGSLKTGPVAVGSDGSAYGTSLAENFAAALKKQGGLVAVRRNLDPHSKTDVAAFLQAAATTGAKAIFFGGRDTGGACQVRAAMAAVLTPEAPFLGGDAIITPACLKDAGPGMSGLYGVSTGPDVEDPLAASSQDAAGALLEAISRAIKVSGGNSPTREEVRRQMAQTSAYPGHWGKFGFDAHGDTTLRIYSVWTAIGTPPSWNRLKTIQLAAQPSGR